jgi:DNA repair exonuclease SbcCD ATPase subunit
VEQLRIVASQVYDVTDQIEAKTQELDRETIVIERQTKMLESNLLKRGLDSLTQELRDFDGTVQAEIDEKMKLENQVQELEQLMESLRAEEGELKTNEGKLQSDRERYEADLRARFKKCELIARKYNVDLTQSTQSQANASFAVSLSQSMAVLDDEDDDNTMSDSTYATIGPDEMKAFYDAVSRKREDLETKLKEHQDRAQEEEDRVTAALTDVGGKLQAVENGKRSRYAGPLFRLMRYADIIPFPRQKSHQ